LTGGNNKLKQDVLWAPWRIGYIQEIDKSIECFFCHYFNNPQADFDNLVLWRSDLSIAVLNRYPYNNGHMLIAPARHIPDLSEITEQETLEMMTLIRDCQKALSLTIKPDGFNIGMNFGRIAGAGLPGHMHVHVVPRWNGDTNFMSVCSDSKVISQSLTELLDQLRQTSKQNNLPNL
jgi:ATP adenylyltransferase